MAVSLTPQSLGQMPTVAEPFVWGGGGRRLTPEQIDRDRQIAAALMQPDYSPVQHWTQGLARLSSNLVGALRERSANKAAARNSEESQAVLSALLSGGGSNNDAVLAALQSPYVDASTKKLAMDQYSQANKRAQPIEINGKLVDPNTYQVLGDYSTPPALPDIVQLSQIANDPSQPAYVRNDAAARITALNDPITNIPLPGGQVYVGPRSGIGGLGSLGPSSPGAPPATLPPDFDFSSGGPTPSASGGFR